MKLGNRHDGYSASRPSRSKETSVDNSRGHSFALQHIVVRNWRQGRPALDDNSSVLYTHISIGRREKTRSLAPNIPVAVRQNWGREYEELNIGCCLGHSPGRLSVL